MNLSQFEVPLPSFPGVKFSEEEDEAFSGVRICSSVIIIIHLCHLLTHAHSTWLSRGGSLVGTAPAW